jgi:hypothetical protein
MLHRSLILLLHDALHPSHPNSCNIPQVAKASLLGNKFGYQEII